MDNFIIYSLRVIIVFFFTFLCARSLTKKAIAQMTAYEIAGIMILANVAAEPLVDKVVIKSVYGGGLLILLMFLVNKLALVNKFNHVFEHTPTLIISKGEIIMKNLKFMGLSLNQLEGLLRQQGYDKTSDVHTAIIEPQGNLSVFPWAENNNVKLKDISIKPTEQGITLPLIMDGNILYSNIRHINKNKQWLEEELQKQGIDDYKNQVALAEIDPSWKVSVMRK
ncbi:hypothetical protein SDC9_75608 [bioreactor metagenome]|uniref:YetF C-terminal domain-containing protein n=1 Tax=bioreactor metagenome TaxID=1076179 RepID=A0A644YL67_9ZZZZ